MAKRKSKKKSGGRPDARYRDPESAPPIISEKRVTFFMSSDMFKRCKVLAARNTIRNTDEDLDGDDAHPDTPSGIARAAIAMYLAAHE